MGIRYTSSAWEADDWVACMPATVSQAWDDAPLQLGWAAGTDGSPSRSGAIKSLPELARRERVDRSYVSRMVIL
jgi:hypothetical protein